MPHDLWNDAHHVTDQTTSSTTKPGRTAEWHARFRERYGPWAIVTGASDGIGREIAWCLAESGLNVVLVARREDLLSGFADELNRAHGVRTMVVAADLGKEAAIDALLSGTIALEAGLLVAAAGFGTSGPFIDAPLEIELSMIDVNCRAVAALSHAFGRRFAARKRGGIVLMSSLVAFQGVPRAANYAATKAFIQTFAEGLRAELRPFGVDVLASAPGPVHSGFAARASMTMSRAVSSRIVARENLDGLGRTGTVRPGLLSKVLELSLMLLPRRGRVRMMGVVMSGMTRRDAMTSLSLKGGIV